MKLSDRDYLRTLENSIRFGKPCLLENVGIDMDPGKLTESDEHFLLSTRFVSALEPVLLRQVKNSLIFYDDRFERFLFFRLFDNRAAQ